MTKVKEIEIITTGELKQEWIETINTNVPTNERVQENMSANGKCYLIVHGKSHIDKIYKTKSARNYVKKQCNQSYYDEYTMEMVNVGASLKIIEISQEEIKSTDDAKLFHDWIFSLYRTLGGGTLNRHRINHFVNKYEMEQDEDIKHLVSDEHLDQMEQGQFDVIDRFQDQADQAQTEEADQAEEAQAVAVEEVEEAGHTKETVEFENNIIEQFEDDKQEIYKLLADGAKLYHTTNQRAVPRCNNDGEVNTYIINESIHKIVVNPTEKQKQYFDRPIYKITDVIEKIKERELAEKIDLDNDRHLNHLTGLVDSQYSIKDIKGVVANMTAEKQGFNPDDYAVDDDVIAVIRDLLNNDDYVADVLEAGQYIAVKGITDKAELAEYVVFEHNHFDLDRTDLLKIKHYLNYDYIGHDITNSGGWYLSKEHQLAVKLTD